MCKVFKISKSSYYWWLKSEPSKRWVENEQLLVKIKEVFDTSQKSYGSPRITEELISLGFVVSRPRTARIMKAAGIRAKRKRKFVVNFSSQEKSQVKSRKI